MQQLAQTLHRASCSPATCLRVGEEDAVDGKAGAVADHHGRLLDRAAVLQQVQHDLHAPRPLYKCACFTVVRGDFPVSPVCIKHVACCFSRTAAETTIARALPATDAASCSDRMNLTQ